MSLARFAAPTAFFKQRVALSGITVASALKAGVTSATRAQLLAAVPRIPAHLLAEEGILFRYHDINGACTFPAECRVRNNPAAWNGFANLTALSDLRYVQPSNSGCLVYFPQVPGVNWVAIERNAEIDVGITEGELKALKATQEGFPTIGLGGVNSAGQSKQLLPLLQRFAKGGRRIYPAFDSDVLTNINVARARIWLCDQQLAAGGRPFIIDFPFIPDPLNPEETKTALDSYLRLCGADQYQTLRDVAKEWALSAELYRMNQKYYLCLQPLLVGRVDRPKLQWKPSQWESSVARPHKTIVLKPRLVKGDVISTPEQVNAAPEWMAWQARTEVMGITFRPSPVPVSYEADQANTRFVQARNGDVLYNLWSPWPVAAIKYSDHEARIAPWLEYIDYICQNEAPIVREFMDCWMAHLVQHPDVKVEQCIALIGQEGSGKGLLGNTYGRLFGHNFAEISKKELDTPFNEWVLGKHFILGSEITSEEKHKGMDELKHMVTGLTIWVNPKHVQRYEVDNYLAFLFTTNYRDAFFTSTKERRFLMIDMPEAKLKDTWGEPKIHKFVEHWDQRENLEALMYHYHTYKINHALYKPKGCDPPTTAAKELATVVSRNEVQAWLEDLKAKKHRTLWKLEELYCKFVTANKRHEAYTPKRFSLVLADYMYQPLGSGTKIKGVWRWEIKNNELNYYSDEFHVWAFKPEHGGDPEYKITNSIKLREIYCRENNLTTNKREAAKHAVAAQKAKAVRLKERNRI